ncbi:AAA family ATPase [Bathymodiolus japonicus methanotrophic gill symbiont]|uniref:AAA family ATPase n=1 Tax=Bathymodiolus japonicus methanotrophic gill symbiont TaxID=113269 RepID=UPI001C8D3F42|nr:AAA family ATPase [Bathymodiolus japonicus methanotrophic gill symbiont]
MVTDALKERFYREVEKINLLGSLPVELRKVKDRNAVSFFQVCFAEKPNEPVGDVFSEGEYRCIALATFLAELVTSSLHSGIIFDDPMSSLDHINRKYVAARLVEESQHRQVIVFTHDLTFLYELKCAAAAEENSSANVHYQTIKRKENRPGYVGGDLPVKATSAIGVAHTLRSEIKTARPNFNNWSDMQRTIFSKGIIEQLREAWDQGIADFISPVLGRFDNRIKGNSLFKLEILNKNDIDTIKIARSHLSEWLHSASEAINQTEITCDTLITQISTLEKWLHDIKKRQKAGSRYFCESLFWASQPKQAAKT